VGLSASLGKKKPALSGFQRVPDGLTKKPNGVAGAEKFLGHENGDEGQQENKNRTSDRNNDWNVFHDTFNGIVGCV
jgi:hypothetical protein